MIPPANRRSYRDQNAEGRTPWCAPFVSVRDPVLIHLQRVDLSLRDQLHAVCGQACGDLLRIHLVRGQADDQEGIAVEVIVKGQLKSPAAVKSL